MRRGANLLAVAVALTTGALAAAGCGDSGSATSATSAATISKASFLRRAERICGTGEDKKYAAIGAALKASGKQPNEITTADLEEVTTLAVTPALREMVERLQGLPPAAEDGAKVGRWVRTLDIELAAVEEKPALFVEGKALASANRQATAMKMRDCVINVG